MKTFVSRQCYYYSGDYCVEIQLGGRDCAGPDMLVEKYRSLGEGKEFDDVREATEAAIKIRDVWQKHLDAPQLEDEAKKVIIGMGNSMGMGVGVEEDTDKNLRARAQKIFDKMPKCDECGGFRGTESFGHDFSLTVNDKEDRYPFCSEGCCDKNFHKMCLDDCNEGVHHIPYSDIRDATRNGFDHVECPVCGREVVIS
jgi:hypothetical protein